MDGRFSRFAVRMSLILFVTTAALPDAEAVSANPNPIADIQPDGTPVKLFIKGDEWLHWYEDMEGYTVVERDGWYYYATLDSQGDLAPTQFLVGLQNPVDAGLQPQTLPSATRMNELRTTSQQLQLRDVDVSVEPIAPTGTVKNIVILIRFSNHTGRTLPSDVNYDTLFNAVGGDPTYAPTGSVADVYYENSYGAFTLDSDIYGWVDLPNTEQYYADGVSALSTPKRAEMITDALDLADAMIDFSQYDTDSDGFVDAIAFVHSGYAAEFGGTDVDGTPSSDRIWSHRSGISTWTSAEGVKVSPYHINPGLWGTSGSDIGRVGVICHETGHFFGLPDLYDTSKPGEGIGSWGMMANSWGFTGSQLNPPHFSAWSKIRLGWVTPTMISSPGGYAAPQVETNPTIYRIDQGFPTDEYLLIENRQPVGFENTMPQGGLAIFHIDDTAGYSTQGYPGQLGWPGNGNHYRVALLQADGQFQLERGGFGRGDSGDVYHGSGVSALTPATTPNTDAYQGGNVYYTGNAITNISASSSNMTFQVDFGDDLRLQAGTGASAKTFEAIGPEGGPFNPPSKDFTISNAGASTVNWQVIIDDAWLTASSTSGSLSSAASDVISLSLAPAVNGFTAGTYTTTVRFRNTGTAFDHVVNATLRVTESLYSFDFDSDPGWTTEGDWAFGVPTGGGSGNGDPTSGFTGSNVYGYNLNGDYPNDLPETYLTTTALDFSNASGVQLSFRRWLGVESASFDHAKVEVSNDGTTWTAVWEHAGTSFSESSWSQQTYDISSVADGQPAVYVRWVMGTTDGSVTYPGWNIDDVQFLGITITPLLSFPLNSDPGWTTEGDWAFGVPTGGGSGNGDPTSGFTGSNVYGYNLNGDYPNNLAETYLTTTALDFSNASGVQLRFRRWLGVESAIFDHAKVQVSNDGSSWTNVWEHAGSSFSESAWSQQSYDISSVADGQPTVYVRWVMGTTDGSVTYPGWNIDDIEFLGSGTVSPTDLAEAWVDFAYLAGPYAGTQSNPFNLLTAAIDALKDDGSGVIKIKGDTATSDTSETPTITKPMRIEASGGSVRIGVP